MGFCVIAAIAEPRYYIWTSVSMATVDDDCLDFMLICDNIYGISKY